MKPGLSYLTPAALVVAMFAGLAMSMPTASCTYNREESEASRFLTGKHQLRKMANVAASESRGDFFLFFGSYSQEESVKVTFAWEMNDGTFAISTLPIEKIRVKIDNAASIPTIKFCWTRSNYKNIQWIIGKHVLYAVITCRDSDWPQDIQLPLQK